MEQSTPFKLLLVDDDIQILLGLEKIISNHFSKDEILIFSCKNGLMATQLLASEPIHAVITDIKMPLYSGIDLLKFINERDLPCSSIVLSGYDDFNLVKNAMRLGASDYLLKPVDEGLLINTLHELKKASSQLPSFSKQTYSLTSILKMQQIVENLVSASSIQSPDAVHFEQEHNISGKTSCLMCYVDIKRALYSNYLTMFQFLTDRVEYFLSNSPEIALLKPTIVYGRLDTYWIFLLFSEEASLKPQEILKPFLELLRKDHFKYSFTSDWYSYDHIHQADDHCRKGFEKYYFDLPYAASETSASPETLSACLDTAADAASSYDYAATIKDLEHCFAMLSFLRPSISEVKKQMNHFVYSILNRNSAFIPAISTSKFTDYDIFEHIENSESLSVLQKHLYSSINYLIGELVQSMENKDDYVIQKAKEYIHNNYQDNLTLNDVASHVFLSENYFSTLFSQKTGTTFRNYLRSFRIEKAKELLTTTNLRIYEVAQRTGYNEHSHFVRAFKALTGQSPGDYRQSKN
ncbi:response regulator transcription factor [Parablautia muri]|nr:helix-turn-helix domain-containing protein [Parablautia muri]